MRAYRDKRFCSRLFTYNSPSTTPRALVFLPPPSSLPFHQWVYGKKMYLLELSSLGCSVHKAFGFFLKRFAAPSKRNACFTGTHVTTAVRLDMDVNFFEPSAAIDRRTCKWYEYSFTYPLPGCYRRRLCNHRRDGSCQDWNSIHTCAFESIR